jgi:hypothetical protein
MGFGRFLDNCHNNEQKIEHSGNATKGGPIVERVFEEGFEYLPYPVLNLFTVVP